MNSAYLLILLFCLVSTNVSAGKLEDEVEQSREDTRNVQRQVKDIEESVQVILARELEDRFQIYDVVRAGNPKGFALLHSPTSDFGLPEWGTEIMSTRNIPQWGWTGVFGLYVKPYLIWISDFDVRRVPEVYSRIREVGGERYVPKATFPEIKVIGKVASDGSVEYLDSRMLMEFGEWDGNFPEGDKAKTFYMKFENQVVQHTRYWAVPHDLVLEYFFDRVANLKREVTEGPLAEAATVFLQNHRADCNSGTAARFKYDEQYRSSDDFKARLHRHNCF